MLPTTNGKKANFSKFVQNILQPDNFQGKTSAMAQTFHNGKWWMDTTCKREFRLKKQKQKK
jgi:hypothetical protein